MKLELETTYQRIAAFAGTPSGSIVKQNGRQSIDIVHGVFRQVEHDHEQKVSSFVLFFFFVLSIITEKDETGFGIYVPSCEKRSCFAAKLLKISLLASSFPLYHIDGHQKWGG